MWKRVIFVLGVGCGGASKPVPQPPGAEPVANKPPAPTCEAVGDKLSTVIDTPDDKPPASIAVLVTERCRAEGWSAEARECFGTAENVADSDGCTRLLTEPQRTGFTGITGAAASADDVLAKIAEFTERMCACKAGDAACAKQVSDDLAAWEKQHRQPQPDPRLEGMRQRMGECMTAAMTPKEERRSRGGAVKKRPPQTSDPCAGGE